MINLSYLKIYLFELDTNKKYYFHQLYKVNFKGNVSIKSRKLIKVKFIIDFDT